MRMKMMISLLLGAVVLAGCQSTSRTAPVKDSLNLVGSDRDEHGCIASAGYQWSELLKDCIRPFETGVKLLPRDTTSTSAAFLVFNADSTKIEAFLPEMKEHPIFSKTQEPAGISWKNEANPALQVKCVQKKWIVYQNDGPIYAE